MRSPDHKAHYGNAVVFEKNKVGSENFYRRKAEIDPLVVRSVQFSQNDISKDSGLVNKIADSVAPRIKEIANVYSEYEVWVKDVALRHLRKGELQAAINISRANVKFFPGSYQAWYWLGIAYLENKQKELAAESFRMSLKLNFNNTLAKERIKKLH